MYKYIAAGIGVFLLLIVVFFVFNNHRTASGTVGIVINYQAGSSAGHVVTDVVPTGQYRFINPFSGEQFVDYPTAQQQLVLSARDNEGELPGNSTIQCQMNGGGILSIGETLTWQVNAAHPELLYLKKPGVDLTSSLNNDINTTLVYGALRSDTLDACTHYSWQDILGDGTGPSKSDTLKAEIQQRVTSDLAIDGIVVNQLFLGDRTPDGTIQAVLNARNNAQQSAYLKQQAQNQAAAEVAKAQGDAQTIKIEQSALTGAPDYIKWLMVNKWDGHLPEVVSGDNPIVSAFSGK